MIRKIILLLVTLILPYSASAILKMELTQGVVGAIPIAVVPFAAGSDTPPQDIAGIIGNDLQTSGRFKVYGNNALNQYPSDAQQVSTSYFHRLGADQVVVGKVNSLGADQYQVSFQLVDAYQASKAANVVVSKTYTVTASNLRAVAHHISDIIFKQLTGIPGVFSTKLAYVVVQHDQRAARYSLEVSDQDGYNPRPLLNSPEPIMSPSWSPNGRQIAYVSFENHRAGIYLQDVASGARRVLSHFSGINGAPAWSPDGRKLALVLSKSGAPNIYVMDINSQALSQLTHDFYINTEPAWSPDGRSLLFTSNRGGGTQIYQIDLANGAATRLSFDGDYNARASFSRDGKSVAMIHKVAGIYSIALLDLDTGRMRVLSGSVVDSASPSMAPNGSMVLYETLYGGRNVLGMVSTDGRIQLRLPARNGEAQDPAWSPV